jgi:hypothetical protein
VGAPIHPGELGRLVSTWEGVPGEAPLPAVDPAFPGSAVATQGGRTRSAGPTGTGQAGAAEGPDALLPGAPSFPDQDLEAVLDEVLRREAERYGLEEGLS